MDGTLVSDATSVALASAEAGVSEPRRDMSEGCDSWALANLWVSVTPLGLLSAVALPVRHLPQCPHQQFAWNGRRAHKTLHCSGCNLLTAACQGEEQSYVDKGAVTSTSQALAAASAALGVAFGGHPQDGRL